MRRSNGYQDKKWKDSWRGGHWLCKSLIFVLSNARAPYMEMLMPYLDEHHTGRVLVLPLLVFLPLELNSGASRNVTLTYK